jgi:hypothetical protein
LSTFQEVKLDESLIFGLIDSILENYEKYGENFDKHLLIDNLNYLEEYFLTTVEDFTSQYLESNNINRDVLIKYIEKNKLTNKLS